MPNRMLRNWTSSEKVDSLSFEAEVFFTRLIMTVDDFGRFHANPKLLKSALYPLKEELTNEQIKKWLLECSVNLLTVYSVDGKEFLQIKDFNQRLRLKTSKFPEMTVKCQSNDGQVSDERPPEVEAGSRSEKREKEVEPEKEIELFTALEVVEFVNKHFGKNFIERNCTRFQRDILNNLITMSGYSKDQVVQAWLNIKLDTFHIEKGFNIVTFAYLSEPKTIERYLFWKQDSATHQQVKQGTFNPNNLNL